MRQESCVNRPDAICHSVTATPRLHYCYVTITQLHTYCASEPYVAGILALGHLHGVNTGGQDESNDLEIARQLMLTCYEMYRRIPTGLSPEIVFFTQHDRGDDYPKQHHMDVGGGEFMVKQQVSAHLVPVYV